MYIIALLCSVYLLLSLLYTKTALPYLEAEYNIKKGEGGLFRYKWFVFIFCIGVIPIFSVIESIMLILTDSDCRYRLAFIALVVSVVAISIKM